MEAAASERDIASCFDREGPTTYGSCPSQRIWNDEKLRVRAQPVEASLMFPLTESAH
jgi:hypothetical protein